MRHSALFILALVLVCSCRPTVPSKYIQPDDMEDILYDYHRADALARSEYGTDVNVRRVAYFQSVLRKHGVSEADFDSSLVYYYSHVDRLKAIYSHVSDRFTDDAKLLGAAFGGGRFQQFTATGDTADIWSHDTDALLIARPTANRLDFTVKGDTTFRNGDAFMFRFFAEYLAPRGSKDAAVCLRATYATDSVEQAVSHVSSTGELELRLPSNNYGALKELKGFVYLTREEPDQQLLLFMSNIQLVRFHQPQTEPTEDETTTGEEAATDSVPEADHARGGGDGAAGTAAGARLRSEHAPAGGRGGVHRVVAR